MPKYYPGKYTNDLRNHFVDYLNTQINKELRDVPEETLSLFSEVVKTLKEVVELNKESTQQLNQ